MPLERELAAEQSELERLLQETIGKLMKTFAAKRSERLEFEALAKGVETLTGRVQKLAQPGSILVPITSLEPKPFDILQTIYVVVQPSDDEYIATFFDANINAGGANQVEAVDNLKDVLLHQFEHWSALPAKKLGPGPRRQLQVLRSFLKRRK
jgi:hypothetical protein